MPERRQMQAVLQEQPLSFPFSAHLSFFSGLAFRPFSDRRQPTSYSSSAVCPIFQFLYMPLSLPEHTEDSLYSHIGCFRNLCQYPFFIRGPNLHLGGASCVTLDKPLASLSVSPYLSDEVIHAHLRRRKDEMKWHMRGTKSRT